MCTSLQDYIRCYKNDINLLNQVYNNYISHKYQSHLIILCYIITKRKLVQVLAEFSVFSCIRVYNRI